MVLHWDAIGMFVELPEIEDTTYVVNKTTRIEMIIFFNEENEGQVLAIDRKPLGTQKIRWKGYGTYQQ
jgi:urate oxidase